MIDTNKSAGIRENISPLLAEFKDRFLEFEYIDYEILSIIKYLRPAVLCFGVFYLFFAIPDYFLINNPFTFRIIFLNRLTFFILVILLYVGIGHIKSYSKIFMYFTLYEIALSISYLSIFYQYESPNFIIQTFGVIIIIIVIFLIPNRLVYMLASSLFITIGFLILSKFRLPQTQFSEFSAAVVYTILVISLNAITSYRVNYYKRLEYINSKYLEVLSTIDPLTGLYNRFKFDEELGRWINLLKRYNTALSIIIFDLDYFRNINDRFGHLTGDKVMLETVGLIKQVVRKTDIFA